MNPEIRQLITSSIYDPAGVRAMIPLLPTEDAALDQLLAEVVAEHDDKAFTFLCLAALAAERNVDCRHLAGGAMLLPDYCTLGCVAWKMRGELPEPLLEAVQTTRFPQEAVAGALVMIAAWCQEHRGGVMPAGLSAAARSLARLDLRAVTWSLLRAVGWLAKDAGLNSVIKELHGEMPKESIEQIVKIYLDVCRTPIFEYLLTTAHRAVASGMTIRRSVPEIGRNAPCPCGSGKKYKRCCFAKDQERLHHSSHVAGRTLAEVEADPERYLTFQVLDKALPHELQRFDPRKIPEDLLVVYLMKLGAFSLFDKAVEAFTALGLQGTLEKVWQCHLLMAAHGHQKEAVRRLFQLHPKPQEVMEELDFGVRLLLADQDAEQTLLLVEQTSRKALQSEDDEFLIRFASGLLWCRFQALGVFVARSLIPIVSQSSADYLFEQILRVRDKLELSPDDPFSDIIDERLRKHNPLHAGKTTAALKAAQQRLGDKINELAGLKDELDAVRELLRHREEAPPNPQPAVTATPSGPGLNNEELRQKVDSLKAVLKERHRERNELRRELQKAQTDLEELRQNASNHPEDAPHDLEDDLLLPEEALGTQPVRLVEFPRGFHQKLASIPKTVARSAITMSGRLAAGDPNAFIGAVRLKACPSVMRLRLGIDFRLLFKLLPETLLVVDLIPRQDLERRIKTLV